MLAHLVDAFAGIDVLVVGEALFDSYLEGTAGRLCREGPVLLVDVTGRTDAPGGAANTAVNVQRLGGRVTFLSVVGDDLDGAFLLQALHKQGVATDQVLRHAARRTLAKHRVLAAGQILLRFDQGCTDPLDPATEQAVLARLRDRFPRVGAVIVSDYGYGLITPGILAALADLQARHPRILVVDSRHHLPAFRDVGITAVKPNYEEVVELLGPHVLDGFGVRADGVALYAEQILDLTGAQLAAVTLDREGALLLERGRSPYRTYAPPARRSCVAGAGDTFVSALTLSLTAGAHTHAAGELAAAAAAVVVAKDATAVCSAQELREYISAEGKYVPDLDRLSARVAFYRQQGKRIVFTNGCFDILHRGHITYLNHAKALGDVLVVGVNSDDSICRLKGPGRPINTLEDRVQVLAALSCIDHLVAFDEDTSCNLVRALRPHVFVKGGDYNRDNIPEAPLVEELGGVVQLLPYLQDRSTTRIIERIQEVVKW
jgi:D-beta-D-heptose 7-phosphate kinase/D-beta-D-heptose 1-phosphate adenosyltransferase